MTRRTLEILALCIAVLVAAIAFHAWLDSHDDQLRLQSTLASQKQILDAADARERDRNAALKDSLAQIETLKRQTQSPEQVLRELPKYLQLPQPITMAPNVSTGASRDTSSSPTDQQGTGPSAKEGTESPVESLIHELLHPSERRDAPRPPANPSSSENPVAPSPSGVPSVPPGIRTVAPRADHGTDHGVQLVPQISPIQPLASAASPNSSAEIPAADLKPLYDYVQDCRACQAQLAAATQNAADTQIKMSALMRERDAAVKTAKGGSFWLRLRRNALWLAIGAGASAAAVCGTGHCK